jgi:hypothetical protein
MVETTTTGRRGRTCELLRLDARTWWRAAAIAVIVGLVIALPTRLVPNGFFRRMTPTRPLDYAFWIMASALLGLVLALRATDAGRQDVKALTAGFGTFLAVGCPVCNKLVVALLGVGGALSIFAPLQPILGTASVVLLIVALRSRLRLRAASWPLPSQALDRSAAS